jgi:hypothetical protein
MSEGTSDIFVMIIIMIIAVIWAFSRFKRWLLSPPKLKFPAGSAQPIEDEASALLEEAGYRVVAGKYRVPIHISVDNKTLESRYYIDYFAMADDRLYIVKMARERQPMEWTGSAVRDRLLAYQLLYRETAGILYVDLNQKLIRKIVFEIDTF